MFDNVVPNLGGEPGNEHVPMCARSRAPRPPWRRLGGLQRGLQQLLVPHLEGKQRAIPMPPLPHHELQRLPVQHVC